MEVALSGFDARILPHERFLRFDWLRAVVFQLNLSQIPTCAKLQTKPG